MRLGYQSALVGLAVCGELASAQPHRVNAERPHVELARRDGHLELPRTVEQLPRMERLDKRATAAAKAKAAAAAASSSSKSKSLSLSKSVSLAKSKALVASKSQATAAAKFSTSSLKAYSSSSRTAAAANYTSSSKAAVAAASVSSANARYSSSSRSSAAAVYTSSSRAAATTTTTTTTTTSATRSSTSSSSSTSASSSSSLSSSTSSSSSSTATTTTTTTTQPVCAPTYTGGATTISGTGTLPKPTTFVKRSGQQLTLNGKTFRIAGPNIYWLCQDENVAGVAKGTPTDKGRVREALAIAVAMGANTVRLTSCGTSVGASNSLEPALGQFASDSSDVWDIHNYVIWAAGQYGLRVIMPLTDNFDYYHGGKYSFLRFLGVSVANNGAAFYTSAAVISAYKDYINKLLTHVNPYNGLAWGQDPTVLAWETGNEFGAYMGKEGYPVATFTSSIATYIKSLSPALVIDGTDGFYNYSTKATAPGLGVSQVDIMSDHFYPRNTGILSTEVGLAANANKNFLIGEYDWTTSTSGATLSAFLSAIEAQPYLGDMLWNVMGHDAQCCSFVTHDDGYSLYYPNGNDSGSQANILAIVKHWYKLTGRTAPTKLPGVACPQPVF